MIPFATVRGDTMVMRPFVKVLWTLVILIVTIRVLIIGSCSEILMFVYCSVPMVT